MGQRFLPPFQKKKKKFGSTGSSSLLMKGGDDDGLSKDANNSSVKKRKKCQQQLLTLWLPPKYNSVQLHTTLIPPFSLSALAVVAAVRRSIPTRFRSSAKLWSLFRCLLPSPHHV
jgi:hypothetical protein